MFLGSSMHMMAQTLEKGTGSHLPHGLSIINTYTEMATGSKRVAIMVKNVTAALITIAKGVKITQAIAANAIPQVGVTSEILEKLDKMQGNQRVKMSIEQRKEAATGLVWPGGVVCPESSCCTCPNSSIPWHLFLGTWEVGCADLVKHGVKVIDD